MPSALRVTKLTKTFKDPAGKSLLVLKDINLEVKSGEFLIILGPSGSGKSTLLRIMSGLEKEYKGEVALGPKLSGEEMSFVFQHFALLPWLSVYENVELGLLGKKLTDRVRRDRVEKELRRLGLEKFAKARPRELSGGMRQRVGIARALVAEPKIIFMDEPFSELDSFTAEDLRQEVLRIWHETGTTIIMVTHLVEEALELADKIAVLTARPGQIEKIINNTLSRPRDKRSGEFFGLEDELYRLIKP